MQTRIHKILPRNRGGTKWIERSLQGLGVANCFWNSQPDGTVNWSLGLWITEQFHHGLGYLEFLEMCQEMHAKPLFGFNCGISLGANDVVPMNQMGPWVKSAVDSVKFADAPADTKWGSITR